MKRFWVLILGLLLCTGIFLLPTEVRSEEIVESGTCGDNLTWTLDDSGTLTIWGEGKIEKQSHSPYPWQDIATSINEIVIRDGVTDIGTSAFYGFTNLLSIDFGNTVVSIGDYAFYCCRNLNNLTIPDSVTYIGTNAIYDCRAITNIKLGCGVKEIGDDAFACRNLKDVYITDVNAWCRIDFGEFCANPLYVCNMNMDGYLHILDSNGNEETDVILDNSITSIPAFTFINHVNMTEIIIPQGVCSIGNVAFYGCAGLSKIVIPNSITYIENAAFIGCTSLTDVTYCGTSKEWDQITIVGELNANLTNAQRSYHDWIDEVTTEPTYTAVGEQVSACVYCGDEKVETLPAKFYGTSVNLGNTLDMYFGFYTGLVDENGKVVFVREFADGTTETTEAPITSFKKNNSVYDITYTGLAAKEMCDTIHVYVYNSEGTLVGEHSDSIRTYILRQLREKNYGQEFRTLCVDLLNYGAAAQVEFEYNEDDLANKDLTAEELAEGTQIVAEYTDKQTVDGDATSYYGTAYILETKISMAMAVRADRLGANCYALVSYTDHTGTEKNNIRLEGTKNYSVYEFFLNEIVVADGRCMLTVEFYKADGTKVLTVQDSMESYTARNAADYPLAEKMLAFSDSAYKYLHRTDGEIAELNVDLLQSEKYVAYELIGDNVLVEYTIDSSCWMEDNVMIFATGEYYYYAEPSTAGTNPVQYGDKTYYGGDGGFGGYWLVVNGNTLEAYDEYNAWLYADSQSDATYVMQCNGDLRLIKGDADQYPYLWTSQVS